MSELTPVVNEFKSADLNKIGAKLIELYGKSKKELRVAQEHLSKAIIRRWHCGKLIADNQELIEEETTQGDFAIALGITPAMASNDKRAYQALLDEGVQTQDQVIPHLQQKGIDPTTYKWERLPKLLNDPKQQVEKDRRAKDEKRLEQLHEEIEEIKARNEGANPSLAERADDTLRYTQGVKNHIESQDIFKSGWRSRRYLDFVRSIGFDYITMQPCENPDPHHTLPDGRSQGPHGKVADMFTIPVSRTTHDQWQGKDLDIKEQLQVAEALVRTMALFIKVNMESDE